MESEIHIGKIIKKEISAQGMSVSGLADLLGMNRTGMSRLFSRKNIHPALLKKICSALSHDFFRYYSDEMKTIPRIRSSPEQELLLFLQTENENLKKEIEFLREVIQSLMKK